jgi:hypothetical protein
MHISSARTLGAAAVVALASLAGVSANAATAEPGTEVITESEVTRAVEGAPVTDNWMLYTRTRPTVTTPPTAAAFVDGPTGTPLGAGSLRLSTADGNEKVFLFNYDHIGTKLADVDDISYSTYRSAGSAQQVAALNAVIDFNGPNVAGGFATLVFEPVYNTDQGPVVNGEWQSWNADEGRWWSTRVMPGVCAFDCFVPWDDIIASNPEAFVSEGVGVNQGSGNAGLTTNVDAFTFDATTYDFERIKDADGDGIADTAPPTSKDDCKKDGYKAFNNPSFKNQGECVSSVATRK